MLRRWLELCAETCRDQRDYLTQLDAAIGDADHGANMDRGFTAVAQKVSQLRPNATPGEVLATAGETLVSSIGGASAALWGTALRRAAVELGGGPTARAGQLAAALDEAQAGIIELGVAQEGDKTMVDALAPALRALHSALDNGAQLADALDQAREAGESGMRGTIPLLALKGRASYLGERSVGHQDPGATSTALILAALASAADSEPGRPGGHAPRAVREGAA
jgi:phosphoenolpyruvate---glycerone phosphotransferase subunit DhaL